MNIPVVLPVARAVVDASGTVSLDVDGEPYATAAPLYRGDLRGVLEDLTRNLRSPVRVEVLESDHTTYTDILTPPATPDTNAEIHEPLEAPALPRVSGKGFRPGEQTALVYILIRGTADRAGKTDVHLPTAVLADKHNSLALVGLDSQTVISLGARPA